MKSPEFSVSNLFLKKGFSLGRAYEINKSNGYVLPADMVILLVLMVFTGLLAFSVNGPGSKHASIAIALLVAVLFGMIAQKNRVCFAGSIRDIILMKNFDLIAIIGGLFVVMLVYNIASGNSIYPLMGSLLIILSTCGVYLECMQ